MNCADAAKLADVHLDGELAEADRRELEEHVARCAACGRRAEAERRLHGALRAGLRAAREEPPPALYARIDAALDAADRPAAARRWAIAACAACAAAALGVMHARRSGEAEGAALVEAVVESHRRDLPLEVASPSPDDVRSWFRGKVDLPVRPPAPRPGAKLVGGRVSHVRDRDAAQLVYDVGGRRVSVLIFDPEGLRMAARRSHRVLDRDVRLDGRRGYNVALFQDRGLGYAVAGEADEAALIDIARAAFTQPAR